MNIIMNKDDLIDTIDRYVALITEEYNEYDRLMMIQLDEEVHSRKWWQFWIRKFNSANEAKEYIFANLFIKGKQWEWYASELAFKSNVWSANKLKRFVECHSHSDIEVSQGSISFMLSKVSCTKSTQTLNG